MKIASSHPRAASLRIRERLVWGVRKGITSQAGLIAHGRGEAFDYLLGEKTYAFAKTAIEAATALFLTAKYPVLSINGNTAVLTPKEFVELAKTLGAKLEVNLFHRSKDREAKIVAYLKHFGTREILLPDKAKIPGVVSCRNMINSFGQAKADVVFVPLEDGDRTEALIALGKKVITIDLNPLSRTAQKATVTIVDNIVRAMPLLVKKVKTLKNTPREKLLKIVKGYHNAKILSDALTHINSRLPYLASKK